MMEELQKSYIRAVAASAGCVVGELSIDDGIDAVLHHKSDQHDSISDRVARLEIQLKATVRTSNKSGYYTVQMRRDRWLYYQTPDPIINKIIVIMTMPSSQDSWTIATDHALSIHHCGYWVNIAGDPDTGAASPLVKAPASQIFSDVALCDMMERIGQGGAP
jgi:uncharacterized protein DUF4365